MLIDSDSLLLIEVVLCFPTTLLKILVLPFGCFQWTLPYLPYQSAASCTLAVTRLRPSLSLAGCISQFSVKSPSKSSRMAPKYFTLCVSLAPPPLSSFLPVRHRCPIFLLLITWPRKFICLPLSSLSRALHCPNSCYIFLICHPVPPKRDSTFSCSRVAKIVHLLLSTGNWHQWHWII